MTRRAAPDARVRDVAALFLKLGLVAFGGPTAHVALMRREAVERRGWVNDREFLDLLAVSNLLPGPTSTELAMLLGQGRAGWRGLVVAGILFILPAAVMVAALAWAYVTYGSTPEAAALLYGVQPVVVAIVVQALVGLARTALTGPLPVVVAALATAAFLLGVNPIIVLLAAGLAAIAVRNGARLRSASSFAPLVPDRLSRVAEAAAPVLSVPDLPLLFLTFLKIGAVVYGSGYVLVAFLRADLVVGLGWLTDRQLLDAVAVGQLTPGPVFTTATFIGFVLAGVPGAAVATVAVFLPAFALSAVAHPLVPRLRRSALASAFLDGVTAAALGLMAGVTFELARVAIVDPFTAVLAGAALVLLLRFRVDPVWLILGGIVAGLAYASVAS